MVLTEAQLRRIERRMEVFCNELDELGCESVAVFVTCLGDGMLTHGITARTGNFYAQKGYLSEWLENASQEKLAHEIGHQINGDEEV